MPIPLPTSDLDAFREVLPTWVKGAWCAMPLLMAAVAAVLMWLPARLWRPKLAGLHWTEAARLNFSYMRLVGLNTLWYAALAGTFTYMEASGTLAPFDRLTYSILVGVLVWLVGVPIKIRAAQGAFPNLRFRDFASGILFMWVVFYPILAVAAAMAILGPPAYDGYVARFWLVYGGGVLATAWLVRGGHLPLANMLRILRPADERANAIIAEASRLSGHVPERVWIARTAMANAAAIPASNQVLITSRALRDMTHDELVAVMLHEFGHLQEPRTTRLRRLTGLLFVFAAAMWRPLIDWVGVYPWIGLLVVCFMAAIVAMRGARDAESDADQHAHEHAPDEDPGVYARALEKLSRLNMIPVVLGGKGQTHPHMYDRMVAAGVTPDYERPEPPPKNLGKLVVLGVMSIAVFATEAMLFDSRQAASYESVDDAMLAVALSAGGTRATGALGYHWQIDQPEKAEVALRVAAANSSWVEYPARLACVLAVSKPDEAREFLARAAERYREMEHVGDWLRELVDDARNQLGLPAEDWSHDGG